MATARDFRGSRRDVALAFSERPRTVYEAAKALGRTTGSIYRLVQRMHDEGLLVADSSPPTRGTQYQLAAVARNALEEALLGQQPTGRLQRHQALILVERGVDQNLAGFVDVLSHIELSGCISWTAALGGGSRLIALTPGASALQADKLAVGLQKRGFEVHVRTVEDLTGAAELQRHVVALQETADAL